MSSSKIELANWQEAPDADLIVCSLAGDYSAFDELFYRYNNLFEAVASSFTSDPGYYVDRLWLTLAENLDRFDTGEQFRVYAIGTLMNLLRSDYVNPWDLTDAEAMRERLSVLSTGQRIQVHMFLRGQYNNRTEDTPIDVHPRISIARIRLRENP